MRIEDFFLKNSNSPTLRADVNSILQATITTYGKNGFHSAHEISDMFKEPATQALFAKYGATLDLQLPDPIKEDGLIDAAKYTLAFARKQLVQEELKIKFST